MIKIKKDQILILVTLDIFLMLQPYSKMDLIISPKILQTIPHYDNVKEVCLKSLQIH